MFCKQNPIARSIVAMLLRQARADYRNVLFARAKLAAEGPKYVDYLAQTTSVWLTSSGCAEIARRMLYGIDL